MATQSTPSSGDKQPEYKPWEPPQGDQEFKFESIDAAPAWVDKGWAGYDQGPALAVPMGDLYGEGPYHTQSARVGDTVKFVAATPSKAAHMVVIPGEPTGENATIRIPQATNASIEDMLKGGTMAVDDLGPDAKAQVLGRSPRLKPLIEEGKGAPKAVPVDEVVKVS
jgi:hypothetical protein